MDESHQELRHSGHRTQTDSEHYENKLVERLISFKSNNSLNSKRFYRVKSQEDFLKKKIPPKLLPRIFDLKQNPLIGPGSYDIQHSTFCTNGKSFPQSKRMIELSTSSVGPGQYNLETRKTTLSHAFQRNSISDHPIRKIRTHITKNSPSPQSYNLQQFKSLNVSKSSLWSKSKVPQRSKIGSITPGPGYYQVMASITRMEKAPIKSKTHHLEKSTVLPGPGQYNLDNGNNKSSLFFTKDRRRNEFLGLSKFVTPGPYLFHKLNQLNGAKFSKAKKPELFLIPDTPSVGFYDLMKKQPKRKKVKVVTKGFDVNLLSMIDLNQSPQKMSNSEF